MALLSTLIRRLLLTALTLFGVWFLTFTLARVAPGSPLDPDEYRNLPPEKFAALERSMLEPFGARGPFLLGAQRQLGRLCTGDLGLSFSREGRTVTELLSRSLPVSITLGLFALLLSLAVGVFCGVLAALYRGRWPDLILSAAATLGLCLPAFAIGGFLLMFFSHAFNVLPPAGWGHWRQLLLPGITLAAPYAAVIARLTRTTLSEQLRLDYVRTARAKGISGLRAALVHALPCSLTPVYAFLGQAPAQLLTGSLVVEKIFAIPGVADDFVRGALERDYPLVIGAVLFYTLFLLLFNQLLDLFIAWTDPRAREQFGSDRRVVQEGEPKSRDRSWFAQLPHLPQRFFQGTRDLGSALVDFFKTTSGALFLLFSRRHKSGLCGLVLVVIMLGYVLLTPLLSGKDGSLHRTDRPALCLAAPSLEAPFGTDEFGRDLFLRAATAGRMSLFIGLTAAVVVLLIGSAYGLLSGYQGGWIDQILQRFLDLLNGLPYIFFVIYLLSFRWFEEHRIGALLMALAAVGWLTMARIVRAETLSLKNRDFVQAARAAGAGPFRLMTRHILPNLFGLILAYATLTIPAIILQESFLSFLGLGIRPPEATWGSLAFDGFKALDPSLEGWWLMTFPCLLLAATLLGLNLLGDALRELQDPRGRNR